MLKIRPFDSSNQDYQTCVKLINLCWPDDPTTEVNLRHDISAWPEKYYISRHIAEQEDTAIGFVIVMETHWSYKPGKYFVSINIHPDHRRQGHATTIYKFLLNSLAQRDPAPLIIITEIRENMTPGIAMLRSLGYEIAMRYPVSELDVPAFDPAPFAEAAARVAESGVKIRTLTEVMADDPDWFEKIYDLLWEVIQDVPSTDPSARPSREEFTKALNSPSRLNDGYFIAEENGQYVGLSTFHADLTDKNKLLTALTGISRSHRRRGIATAMKVRAIAFAKQYGADVIVTDNEENNPMFQINLKLGFKPVPAWIEYQKAL